MLKIAISALAISSTAFLALPARTDVQKSGSLASASAETTTAEAAAVPVTSGTWTWGSPPINPTETIKASLVDTGPIRAPEGLLATERQTASPVQRAKSAEAPLRTYTTHPASPAPIRIIPVRLGGGFSPEQRLQIINALREWNQVLNGYGRLQIADDGSAAKGTWLLRPATGAAPSPASSHSLQTLAYTQPTGTGGGTVLVYTDRIGTVDLGKVMRHELGHVLGLQHDPRGGVMAARYSDIAEPCVDRQTAERLAAIWQLGPKALNWCEAINTEAASAPRTMSAKLGRAQ